MAWVRCCGGSKKSTGTLLPNREILFSDMFKGSGVSITYGQSNITKTGTGAWGNFGSIITYDFTNYSNLTIKGTVTNFVSDNPIFGYGTNRYTGSYDWWRQSGNVYQLSAGQNGDFTISLDISNVTGNKYIMFGGGHFNCTITEIKLS